MAPSDASNARAFSRLRHRPITRRDLAEALQLLPPWLGLDETQRREVAEVWDRLVNEPSMLAGVIEDLALPAGERIQRRAPP